MFQRRVALHPIRKLREALWPSIGWRRATIYVWRRIWRLSGTPHTIAVGIAAGTFMSFTPFLGFHIVMAMLITWVFRGNLVAAAFGTLVGNPFTYPPIWLATYDLGNWMIGARAHPDVDIVSTLMSSKAIDAILPVLVPMTVGSLPLGLASAAIAYFLTKRPVAVYQQSRRERLAARIVAAAENRIPEAEDLK